MEKWNKKLSVTPERHIHMRS